MLVVRIRNAQGQEERLAFAKPTIMIGRAEGNDICLAASRGVSRYHARADVEDQVVVIQDLESTNGVFVNTEKVSRKKLGPTELVSIGDAILSFSVEENSVALDAESPTISQDIVEPSEVPAEEKAKGESRENQGEAREKEFYWSALKNFLQPVWGFLADQNVSEILINGAEDIYIESNGSLRKTEARFTSSELKAAVLNIAQYVGRRVSEEEPYLDARLPDGSRVAVLLPPCSRSGIAIAIRKFSQEALTIDKLLAFGSLSQQMATFIRACVELKKNIIISGGTSSGKTSLLNVVSSFIPEDERIITIEDAAELQLKQEHVLAMETKPPDKKGRGQVTMRDLLRVSLRMRPDRIILGEMRGGEALDLLQAMNTGHSGSMSTVHASSPAQALTRLETLALFSGIEIPMMALREQVGSAIEIIIQAARLPDHTRKVTHISAVVKAADRYLVKDIFAFKRKGTLEGKVQGEHVLTGEMPDWLDEMELAGLSEAASLFRMKEKS